jgi:hypothetical protein
MVFRMREHAADVRVCALARQVTALIPLFICPYDSNVEFSGRACDRVSPFLSLSLSLSLFLSRARARFSHRLVFHFVLFYLYAPLFKREVKKYPVGEGQREGREGEGQGRVLYLFIQ